LASLTFIDIIFAVEAVHQKHIDKDDHNKGIDRSLLGKPKTQFKTTDPILVKEINEEYAASVGNNEPDAQKYGEIFEVG